MYQICLFMLLCDGRMLSQASINFFELRCGRLSIRPQKFFQFRYNLVCGLTSTRYVHQLDFDLIQGQDKGH